MSVLSRKRTYLPAEDRRAQILGVAKGVFAKRGYHGSNVADICKAAKIGRGTLYQYFDNKRDVMLAVVEEVALRVERIVKSRPRVREIPGVHQAPVDMIVAFCKRRFRELLDAVFVDEATLRLILREARGFDGVIDRMIARIDGVMLEAMIDDCKASQEAGLTRPGDPRLMALYVLGGVEKMVLAALAGDEPIDLSAIVDHAVEMDLFGTLKEEVRR
jgi:AcrR family transcriptional regulator